MIFVGAACSSSVGDNESSIANSLTTDGAQYGFENGTDGWISSGSPLSVSAGQGQVFAGTGSLTVSFNGSKGSAYAYVNTPAVPPGSKVNFHVWCPASIASAVQPYALQGASGNWAWTGNWQAMTSLQASAWNTIVLTVPSNAAPLAQLGVQFQAGTGSGNCYVDSVGWGSGTTVADAGSPPKSSGVDAGSAPPPVDAGHPRDGSTAPPPDPCVAAGTCPSGSWTNVTPAINLNPNYPSSGDNYGVLEVVVDPVIPSTLYAFVCYQGVWKSTDYGLTWVEVDTGTNANHLKSGRPWTAAIDPNPSRNPSTPPALYTVAGYGDQLGVYKSTDGGVNWAYYTVGNAQAASTAGYTQGADDVYSLDIDPYNSNHLLATFHSTGLSESTNGGQTWTAITTVPSNFGTSDYVWFVASASSATTSGTWLTQAQWNNNTTGIWRTTDSGAHWTQVLGTLEHTHGCAQISQDGQGNIYATGQGTGGHIIYHSGDYGQTWTAANNGGVQQNGVFATPNYLYATYGWANQGGQSQHLQRSPRSDGVNWSDWSPIAPAGMSNGADRAAVTFDGQHYIIVSGNWLAGIWRYVE